MEFLQEKGNVQMSKIILEIFGIMDSIPVKSPCEPHFHDLLRQNKDSPIPRDSKKFRELVGSPPYFKQYLACFSVTGRGDAQDRESQPGYMCYSHTNISPISWTYHKKKKILCQHPSAILST